ncbi:RNA polymerase subunit sigma-70 [Streptomyces sp. SID13031]|uniref:RNA polymerase subunit sigma-70 n=1 Tax=Streptomyces sp. SID13031 TaxID=2706046 RepID=UPI0013C569CA|nr:RNA polymerase subunit sigma-70 [Streptomyces sp. SID13031]NEA36656.1 sigma-70 family RNA polymerase sigma factor [Streptomyces sp. SID13031]
MGEQTFEEITAPYLRELHLHCYRMLGSTTDADDVLQEVLLAAWRGLDSFAGRSSLRTWLYRIATNRCLNAIRDGKRRPRPEPLPPFDPPAPTRRGDVTWLQPYPDEFLDDLIVKREHIALAFITALQRMPPRQTAALILVDVLDFPLSEVADLLDTTPTAIKGALQRARASLHSPPPPRDAETERAVAKRFAEALAADDIAAVKALLSNDAWLSMPPAPHEYYGPEAIAAFLQASAAARAETLLLEPIGENLHPAFTCYFVGESGRRYTGCLALTVSGDRISTITRFLDPVSAIPFDPSPRHSR